MRIYPTVALVLPLGNGARPTRSVAWRWETNVGVVVPIAAVDDGGTPVNITGLSGTLCFWASELDDAPALSVALVATDPTNGLGTFTMAASALAPGDYAVGALLNGDTALTLGRVQIFKRSAQ